MPPPRREGAKACTRTLVTTFAHFQHGGHEPEVAISIIINQWLISRCSQRLD